MEATVILQTGSFETKIGFGGDEVCRSTFPTLVGSVRMAGMIAGPVFRGHMVGDEAMKKRGILTLRYPVERGLIKNWDDGEKIWHHAFYNELRVAPEEHPCFMIDQETISLQREKMTQIMFETFNVPALYIGHDPFLCLAASGCLTGLVVDVGHESFRCTPFDEGHAVKEARVAGPVGGRHLTEYMAVLLAEQGYSFTTSAEREIVRDMKEKLCYLARVGAGAEEAKAENVMYELPDGQCVAVQSARVRCPEALFHPDRVLTAPSPSLHSAALDAVAKAPEALRPALLRWTVLSGGSSLFPALPARLLSEMTEASPGTPIRVFAPSTRKYSAWLGASILSCLGSFSQCWLSKMEYDENGPARAHHKFIL